jgi:hypothetical protein
MFSKQKNEIKQELTKIFEEGKNVALGAAFLICLTVGYLAGVSTAGTIYTTSSLLRRK